MTTDVKNRREEAISNLHTGIVHLQKVYSYLGENELHEALDHVKTQHLDQIETRYQIELLDEKKLEAQAGEEPKQ